MARILVTGGAGFIGSHLARALVQRGDEVVVLDDLSTGRRANLEGMLAHLELIEGSLLDDAALGRALRGVDAVLHQAAMPSVPKSLQFPRETHRANVEGTLALLDAARRLGVRRVVYAGSSSAYGDQPDTFKSEDLTPRPMSPYAVQKLTGEHYCAVHHALFGLETITLRYFNVFGPRQDPASQYAAVVPAFVTRMLRGESPVVHGDGLQSRDFTYIENVVEANLAALAAPPEACGKVYNAACGHSTSLLQLVAWLNGILGTSIAPIHEDGRAGDVRASCADPRRAQESLGFSARIDVREGLTRTVAWYREAGSRRRTEP
jgi:UDP-glucose 4-epimerase